MVEFCDTHAHLHYPDFEPDLAEVIRRAAEGGVTRIIAVGTDLESSRRAIELSQRHPGIDAAVGWHPNDAVDAPADLPDRLRELARHPRVVALGETGLDYFCRPAREPGAAAAAPDRRRQAELFRAHLEVAAESGLPCIVHQRDAAEDALEQWRPWADRVPAVFHCFTGDEMLLGRILSLGGFVSYTGIVTFRNAAAVRSALAATPLDRLMLETDAPFLAPEPHRGKRAEPAHVARVAERAAEVKGVPLKALAEITCANAARFFRRH
ncbi:MAG TPA: TatD family hydrolase [Candidatus Paceibacterota bacterium]|nr:TatD family hydrolase [Verrucomicrobiota bacterium]HOX04158.1 TatD family hydrolase [Verrucomicrobiota bacterium]HRZ47059.1 TatD family hydrolase [Candidatus Paceibacterota bacterium]